jgi:sigma-B regulation protein RsbU (phosphoserine phosphatase)
MSSGDPGGGAPEPDALRVERLERQNAELARENRDLTAALRALEARDRRGRDDLAQAQAFQQQILPRPPAARFFACRAIYRPVDLVGGDLYDIEELDRHTFRFFVADAPGHGVQAAMRTMIVKTEYDRLKATSMDPAQLLDQLNDRICRTYPNLELPFTACCFDLIEPRDRRGAILRSASGAHPALLVAPRTPASPPMEVRGDGGYLGVMPGLDVDLVEVRLPPGVRLLAFTDGLIEPSAEKPGEPDALRMARILHILRADRPLDEVVGELQARIEAPVADSERADDITAIVVEIPFTSADPRR